MQTASAAGDADGIVPAERRARIAEQEAAREAVRALESGALPTREYLDYMWQTDVGMRELRSRMDKLRERIAELEAIKADAEAVF